jgi:hypothetical protein
MIHFDIAIFQDGRQILKMATKGEDGKRIIFVDLKDIY